MKPAAFDWVQPATLAGALEALARDADAKPVSGSQSFGPMLNLRLAQPSALVALSDLAELRACREQPDEVSYGAAIRHAEIEDGLVPDATAGLMRAVAASIAYRAVRNRGTLGGSLAHCDPAADWVNLMPLLDAKLVVRGPGGERTVPAATWMQAALVNSLELGEVLVSVRVPRFGAGARWGWWKLCRKPGEFSTATAAVLQDPARGIARALVGATGDVPHVVADAGRLVSGFDEAFAASEVEAAGLARSSYAHRVHVAALRRACAQLAQPRDGAARP